MQLAKANLRGMKGMNAMSSDLIVQNCAPTLAGLKAGSIFPQKGSKQELCTAVSELDHSLMEKGVRARLLFKKENGPSLVYIYRTRCLEKIIADRGVRRFLAEYGYTDFTVAACLDRLEQRLAQEDFPHEIGVFLDYPLADIQAFIENKGRNCPCTGCWKAYTNIPEAQRKFKQFRHCTALYRNWVSGGADLTRLTVAG